MAENQLAVSKEIEFETLENLHLDPQNPRLGRALKETELEPDEVLRHMRDWTLDELAQSFLENGFWPQEPLIVVEEGSRLIVVEGNRRLAALKLLKQNVDGDFDSRKWSQLTSGRENEIRELISAIPIMRADDRSSVNAFLGFRHVTGIKEWDPAEKAEFIVYLIDNEGYTYEEVMRKIGSKTPTVRKNYIAFHILLQMEQLEEVAVEKVEDRFSVLYLSLREPGVRSFLGVSLESDLETARRPVPDEKLDNLTSFTIWLFGDEQTPPVLPDSRQITKFGRILENDQAIAYLKRTKNPNFERASQYAGAEVPDLLDMIRSATDTVEQVLSVAHQYVGDEELISESTRLDSSIRALYRVLKNAEN